MFIEAHQQSPDADFYADRELVTAQGDLGLHGAPGCYQRAKHFGDDH